jgi:hypothetical protein
MIGFKAGHGIWFMAICALLSATTRGAEPVTSATIRSGNLEVVFQDNSQSPRDLSGVPSLFNVQDAPGYDAFDPDGPGSSAGLNFEHIIAGHRDEANKFRPRHGPYTLYRLNDGISVQLERRREDCPWDVSSTMKYTVVAPHAIDFEFRCTPHNASRFGSRGYGIFFWANYMNEVEDVALHFRGVEEAGGQEKWVAATAPPGHPDYIGGGTYRSLHAKPLEYDADHNFKLNVWSYDYPRFTRPFYLGRAGNGMAMILMFDRMHSAEDEMRFSLFKFKVSDRQRRPAWDFQYVIHRTNEEREYGFRGRLIWKKFVSHDDALAEYEAWTRQLD